MGWGMKNHVQRLGTDEMISMPAAVKCPLDESRQARQNAQSVTHVTLLVVDLSCE
jgi:hypothetical protein